MIATETTTRAGFRFGDRGTHTSRTFMLTELRELLDVLPPDASRADYAAAIIEDNLLGKRTTSTRRLTNQRLGELYGLAPGLPLFRVLRRLWSMDKTGRPLLALLCALARDPLLRATSTAVLPMQPGTELLRSNMLNAIRMATGDRLNESVIDKVARNASSTWTQSGHLEGRVRKIRQTVNPTACVTAYALWLGSLEGKAGEELLTSTWAIPLDRTPDALVAHVLQAKQLGLVRASIGGGITEIDPTDLDPLIAR